MYNCSIKYLGTGRSIKNLGTGTGSPGCLLQIECLCCVIRSFIFWVVSPHLHYNNLHEQHKNINDIWGLKSMTTFDLKFLTGLCVKLPLLVIKRCCVQLRHRKDAFLSVSEKLLLPTCLAIIVFSKRLAMGLFEIPVHLGFTRISQCYFIILKMSLLYIWYCTEHGIRLVQFIYWATYVSLNCFILAKRFV